MIRLAVGILAISVALAGAPAGSPAIAADLVVEVPLASRVVLVSPADLTIPERLAALRRKLRAAARDACNEQYPAEMIYFYSRACSSGSFQDALGQLREVQARQLAQRAGAGVKFAISVRPR